jgi:hypothetical protein
MWVYTLADAHLLHLCVAGAAYMIYLPVLALSLRQLFVGKPHMVVFSTNKQIIPIRSWLRFAFFLVMFTMFLHETADVLLDALRYWQVKDLSQATGGAPS